MADHIDNGLIASIKALTDVVAQSVDSTNPLAREQLTLVTRYLGFLRQRLPYQFERDRFELDHYLALAKTLTGLARPCVVAGAPSLEAAASAGEAVLLSARSTTAQLRSAIDKLTTAISVLVRCVAGAEPDVRLQVERQVTVASARLFDLQRAWYLPMGFEPDPKLVSSLEQALAASPIA